MAPIRLALIGLSQSAKTSWASSAHLPYLLSERGRERYKIAALLNSSEAAAKQAIDSFDLGSDVKAYGSPADLAADPDVDLVACATRVDVHYDTIKPSVDAGKDAFVEWPLTENAGRAEELAALARKSGSKTMVGLQARVAPVIWEVKRLLGDGVIGKVVSSDVIAYTPGGGGLEMSTGLAYFLDKKVGGNPVSIAFAHTIDYIHFVLGEYESSDTHTQIQRPKQQVVNKETGERTAVTSDVPDLVSVHGTLHASETVAEGATLVVNFRSGPPFPGTKPFVWTITGETGSIRISNERGPFIQSAASAFPTPVELHRFSSDGDSADKGPSEERWTWEDWQEPLPPSARNIGKLYDLFFENRLGEFGAADFDGAVVRHKEIDQILYP